MKLTGLLMGACILGLLTACSSGGGGGGDDNRAPTAVISATPTRGTAPLSVSFNARSSRDTDGRIVSYLWDFGDNKRSTLPALRRLYKTAGTYTVNLTVTDNSGASDTTTTTITVTPGANTFSVSGTISSGSFISVDSDVNDPNATHSANNTPAAAQTLPNPVMLNGFVSVNATGVNGDRFFNSTDPFDYYRATLSRGQYVSLRVASFKPANPRAIDVDIGLFDSSFNLVAASDSLTEFESVAVPADGEYYIGVRAYSGISKYVLSVGSTSFASGSAAYGKPGDFLVKQAIIKQKPQLIRAKSVMPLSQQPGVRLTHQKTDRPALLSFESNDAMAKSMQSFSTRKAKANWGGLPRETVEKLKTLTMIKELGLRPDVEYAEPNYIIQPMATPNDTYFNHQHHYTQIRLENAWDITTGTPASGEVIVAVVDTGVFLNHEDLTGQLVPGYDFISNVHMSNDGDGIDTNPDDPGDSSQPGRSSWHGTHVAGTVAAASNNNNGVAGVSWGAKIMPLRVLGKGGGNSYDIDQAVRFAAGLTNDSGTVPSQRADIINLSLGGGGHSQTSQNIYTAAYNAGVIVIAAAGNENTSVPSYPASYNGVVSVSAMDWQNNRAPYSNFGANIDVGAPGGDASVDRNGDGYGDGVLSLSADDSNGTRTSSYKFQQGTSMAAPHVAGVAALMKAIHPGLTPVEFDTALANGRLTNDLGSPGRDNIYGHGMIDALKAVQTAQALTSTESTGQVIATPALLTIEASSNSATLTLSTSGDSPPSVVSASADASWLQVANDSVNANGIGTYKITVDRSGLLDANYAGKVYFSLSNSSTLTVVVNMRVQQNTTASPGDAGHLYIILLDSEYESIKQVHKSDTSGRYPYQFNNVSAGEYYVIAGSDVDNDGFICEIGESCGSYPLQRRESLVNVNQNITSLDFSATINTGLSAQSDSADEEEFRGYPIDKNSTDSVNNKEVAQ